jgi:hypothetical protein
MLGKFINLRKLEVIIRRCFNSLAFVLEMPLPSAGVTTQGKNDSLICAIIPKELVNLTFF